MKKSLFIVLMLIFSVKSWAQDSVKAPLNQVPFTLLRKLEHDLALNSEQKKTVLGILIDRSKQLDQIKVKDKKSKLTKTSCKQANDQATAKLNVVLTADQRETLKILRKNDQSQKKHLREEQLYKSILDIELDF